MKKLTLALLLQLSFYSIILCQTSTYQCYVEIKDTSELAIKSYHCGWEQNGFAITEKVCKDTIGLDSIRITKLFYLDECNEKVYLDFFLKEYIIKKSYNIPYPTPR